MFITKITSGHSSETYAPAEREEPKKQKEPLPAPTRNSKAKFTKQANVIFIVPELHQHHSRNLTGQSPIPTPTATNQKRNHESSGQSFHSPPCSGTDPNKPGFAAVEN